MTILTNKVLAIKYLHQFCCYQMKVTLVSELLQIIDDVEFLPIKLLKILNDGIWVTGIPNLSQTHCAWSGFVKNGEEGANNFPDSMYD